MVESGRTNAAAGLAGRNRRRSLAIAVGVVVVIGGVVCLLNPGLRPEHSGWEQYRAELEKRGEKISWRSFIPPAVPDRENFFETPGMAGWFTKGSVSSNSSPVFEFPANARARPVPLAEVLGLPETADEQAAAIFGWPVSRRQLREWFSQREASCRLLKRACARPFARINTDYLGRMDQIATPNFVALRAAVQALATHANLSWADQHPDAALEDLRLVRRLMDVPASGPTLVSGMIRVAICGLYTQTVLDALKAGALRESDLIVVEEQIKDVNLLETLAQSLRAERAAGLELLHRPPGEVAKLLAGSPFPRRGWFRVTLADWQAGFENLKLRFRLRSADWVGQNLVLLARCYQDGLDEVDPHNRQLHAQALTHTFARMQQTLSSGPDNGLAGMLVPNCSRAALSVAKTQTRLHQLQAACALERYRRMNGSYPETLEWLKPAYLDSLPRDLFTGRPLRYRRTADGGYQLWSVGWDEQDNAGMPGPPDQDGEPSYAEDGADWVREVHPP